MLFLVTWLGCADEPVPDTSSPPTERGVASRLFRGSMALRGTPPSADEVQRVLDDPAALEEVLRSYLDAPEFRETIADMHGEQLHLRWDTIEKFPRVGPLEVFDEADVRRSLDEEPVKLAEQIVATGRPYTELVAGDLTMANEIVSVAYGLSWDPQGPEWQESRYTDGRPLAGILSSNAVYQRYQSTSVNLHRARARFVLEDLLCEDLSHRASFGILDPLVADEAVLENPDCVGCHSVMDPLAASFYGMIDFVYSQNVRMSHTAFCMGEFEENCYPLEYWKPELIATRAETDLPPPALYGTPADNLEEMGDLIAADPRFASCTVRRFWGWMANVEPLEVAPDLVDELESVLVGSDWDARELMIAIAMHPRFATTSPDAPPYAIRPGQLDRTISALTGHEWRALVDESYGEIGLATTTDFGLRALLGGTDGWVVTEAERGNLPTRELALQWVASEAAHHAVEGDLLLHGPTKKEDLAREQIVDLHLRFYAERLEPDAPEVDRSWALLSELMGRSSAEHAWKVLLTAMLQDPRLVVI